MDLKEINEKIKNLDVPEKNKEAFLELMNLKINNDMEKVLNAIGALKNELNTFDHKLDTSIGALKSENNSMKWVIGISSAAIGVLLTILGLIFAFKK